MRNKLSLRVVFFSLLLVVLVALTGSTVLAQEQSGQPSTKPTANTNTQSSAPTSCTAGDTSPNTKPQSGTTNMDMNNMDMSKMDMGNKNAGNMDMSGCPCPNCKSGGCANGSCSLRDHVAARTNKPSTVTTKRHRSRAQPKKKTP